MIKIKEINKRTRNFKLKNLEFKKIKKGDKSDKNILTSIGILLIEYTNIINTNPTNTRLS